MIPLSCVWGTLVFYLTIAVGGAMIVCNLSRLLRKFYVSTKELSNEKR
jgi:hypothetical protein